MIRVTQSYDLDDPRDTQMFEARRLLFVDVMRWNVPVVNNRFEIDQFDGSDATYLCDFDEHGAHRGSLRLLTTDRPHILGDLFPALCLGPVPRGTDVAEITRLCLPMRTRAEVRLRVRNRLISAMVDHASAAGIRALTGVVRPSFRDTILAMGWAAEPLGPPRAIGGMTLAAFRVTLDADTPVRLARNGIYAPTRVADAVAA